MSAYITVLSRAGAARSMASTAPLVADMQFVKNLSFEVLGAPEIVSTLRSKPKTKIKLDVQPRRIHDGQNVFEVALEVKAEALEAPVQDDRTHGRPLLIVELSYAGIFTLNGVPENTIEQVLLVDCPRLLFQSIRNIVSDVTRVCGLPPMLLRSPDFLTLWQARKQHGPRPLLSARRARTCCG